MRAKRARRLRQLALEIHFHPAAAARLAPVDGKAVFVPTPPEAESVRRTYQALKRRYQEK